MNEGRREVVAGKVRPRAGALVVALLLVALGASPLAARLANKPIPHKCPPCLALANAYVRADVSPFGTWAMGTTGGDPDTPDDDHKTMIYGFKPGGASDLGSSYTTVRVIGPNGSMDALPKQEDTVAQFARPEGDGVTTVWAWRQPHRVRVTQTLALAANPFSGRPDATYVTYELRNEDAVEVRAGVRALIDVKLGQNDGAPYIVPGVGAVSTERDFRALDVPPFWLAFESPTYDPRQLRGVGMLQGPGLASPDRAVIAWWVSLRDKPWEYTIDPTQTITTDSAVALYYDPLPLAPGSTRAVTTSYGIAGNRGGEVFLSSPSAMCGSEFPVSLFVSNFGADPLLDGAATLDVPPGLALAAGEAATKPLGTIGAGRTGSAVWRLLAGSTAQGDFRLTARASFAHGRVFHAEHIVRVACLVPTPGPTLPTAVPTPLPAPSPTAEPGPGVCAYILPRVPPAAIAQAVADPQKVGGWGMLCQPNLPPSPWNIERDRLALLRASTPYHPQFNPLVYKCQCP